MVKTENKYILHITIYYQIFPMIFLKKFMKSNLNSSIMIENIKILELHVEYATVSLKAQTLKMI